MNKENTGNLLAIERTQLANERNFLAYFRTFMVFLSSGIAIFKLNDLEDLKFLAVGLIAISILILAIGTLRYFQVKKRVNSYKD